MKVNYSVEERQKNSTHQPINKIVNELSKLKRQLKQIKSTKTLPKLSEHHHNKFILASNKKQNKKYQTNSKTNQNFNSRLKKPFSLLNNKSINQKQEIEMQRDRIASEINMKKCKQIIKSHSASKSRSESKSMSKSMSKSKSKSKNSRNNKSKSNQQNTQKKYMTKNKNDKNQQLMKNEKLQKISSFDNLFAVTKSVRKSSQNQQSNSNKHLTHQPTKSKKKNPLINQINNQHHYNDKQISFSNNNQEAQEFIELQKSNNKNRYFNQQENKKIQLSFIEQSYRLKTLSNYEPQFNSFNFASHILDHKNLSRSFLTLNNSKITNQKSNIFNKETYIYNQNQQIGNKNNQKYHLKSQIVLNKLKKSLLRLPNFVLNIEQSLKQHKTLQMQRLLAQINEKQIKKVQERYTLYLQQIQCDVNSLINLVNQYENDNEKNLIEGRKKMINNQKYHVQMSDGKENQFNQLNFQHSSSGNILAQRYKQISAVEEMHKKQTKSLKKQIKRLQKSLHQQQQAFIELQFKYILKCQQQQNSQKLKQQLLVGFHHHNFNENRQQNQISSHLQLLQEEISQLYVKIELIEKQSKSKDKMLEQMKSRWQNAEKQSREVKKEIMLISQQSKFKDMKIQQMKSIIREHQIVIQKQSKKHINLLKQIQTLNEKINSLQSQKSKSQKQLSSLKNKLNKIQIQLNNTTEKYTSMTNKQKQQNRQIQKMKKNQIFLNNKIQQSVKLQFVLIKQNEKLKAEIKSYRQELKLQRLKQEQLTRQQQQNNHLRSQIQKANKKVTYLSSQLKKSQQQISNLNQTIEILQSQLTKQYNKTKTLQQSIQRYKNRCIKAQIQLKQQRYLQQRKQTQKQKNNFKMLEQFEQTNRQQKLVQQKKFQNTQEIKNIFKSYQDKLHKNEKQKQQQ